MMRVPRISASMRGTTPGLASGGAYATPLGATMSLRMACAWVTGKHLAHHMQQLECIPRQLQSKF